jgi:hypothetical protein
MLISDATWKRIRERFTEEDKQALRDAYLGETICPKGIVIDEARLDNELRTRVAAAKGSFNGG